jgi:hypothetical protein
MARDMGQTKKSVIVAPRHFQGLKSFWFLIRSTFESRMCHVFFLFCSSDTLVYKELTVPFTIEHSYYITSNLNQSLTFLK